MRWPTWVVSEVSMTRNDRRVQRKARAITGARCFVGVQEARSQVEKFTAFVALKTARKNLKAVCTRRGMTVPILSLPSLSLSVAVHKAADLRAYAVLYRRVLRSIGE